jgi:hypothetical protein
VLTSSFFQHEDYEDEIDLPKLLLWGVLLCQGSLAEKTRVFYDVLQDSLQENISACDKDFDDSFRAILVLSSQQLFTWQTELQGNSCPTFKSENFEDEMEEMKDEFLDAVFGAANKIKRLQYLKNVENKTPWIFSTE